jgi:hypothetical protein
MDAGATNTAPPRTDIFDRIGDAVGNAARDATTRFVDRATVFSPLVGITRGITDPEGAKQSFHRVGKDALDAVSILNPGVGIARWFLGTDTGRKLAAEGAKGAVDAATVGSPVFAAGRAIVDPEGTKDTFERAGTAVKDYVESPLTGYGLAKHAVDYAKDHPDQVRKAAHVGLDIATVTNPIVAWGRGIASVFGGD